jgi:cytochrome c biogenesis protein CcmG/thiol:disulfide interchange protein DsbE
MEDTSTATRHRSLPAWVIALAFALLIGFLALLWMGMQRSKAGPITVGQNVPDFTFTTFEGEITHTSELKGKVIVLNFWASWCKPCEQEAAEIEAAWKKYQPTGEVVFLGIDYVDTEPEARKYLEKFAITYPNGPDLRTSISQLFRIRGVPETYFIDREGTLAYVKVGPFSSIEEIESIVDGLLK